MKRHASFNRCYSLLWSDTAAAMVPVPETARSAGKGAGQRGVRRHNGVLAAVALACATTTGVWAQAPPAPTQLPTGGHVVQGAASISQSSTAQAASMVVNQSSARAVVDWGSFNVGANAQVRFNQPNAQSATLNRVNDANPSQIFGRIGSNGQVILSNANGVYFSPSSRMDMGALTATTHSIDAQAFMAGSNTFGRNGATGRVVNEGQIHTALGGYVALLAPEVQNSGVIVARAGAVALASGEQITLNLNSQGGLAGITTTASTLQTLIENRHAIAAPDGLIILSGVALNKLQAGLVKNSGALEANSLTHKGGKVVLEGDEITLSGTSNIEAKGPRGGGTVLVGGDWQGSGDLRQASQVTMAAGARIDASATEQGDGGKVVLWSDIHNASGVTQVHGSIKTEAGAQGGDGGKIETSGHWLVTDGIQVSTHAPAGEGGHWLLDPYDVTISSGTLTNNSLASGVYTPSGNSSVVNVTTLVSNLNSTNGTIEIATTGAGTQAGNIDVAANISWARDSTLKLSAAGGITSSNNSTISTTASAPKLIFNQAGDSTYSGLINGNIALTKQGLGTLTLTGANTFSKGILLQRGNIILGEGGTLGRPSFPSGSYASVVFGNTVDESVFAFDKSGTTLLNFKFSKETTALPGVIQIKQGTLETVSDQMSATGSYLDLWAGTTIRKTDTVAYFSLAGIRGSGNVAFASGSGLYVTTLEGVTSTFSGAISGGLEVGIQGGGTQVFSGANTYTGSTSISTGSTLRISNANALGATGTSGYTDIRGTLELDGGITVAEPLRFVSGATIRSVSGNNVLSSSSMSGLETTNVTFKVDADSLNFSNTSTKSLVGQTWQFFLTGNLSFSSPVNSGTLKKAGSGTLSYVSRTGTAPINATAVYVQLYDPTGNDFSSIYGSAPDLTYGFFDAASGGNLVDTAGTGSATWTGVKPTSTSAAGAYPLRYSSGVTPTNTSLAIYGPGDSATWTVLPKPITITMVRPTVTYDGKTTYAQLLAGATFTSTSLVGTDKLGSFTRTVTPPVGFTNASVAQAGTYTVAPSAAVLSAGSASNYSFVYTPITGTVQKAALTMTANDASILVGQPDPSFTARYTGFVNGETPAVLTSASVTRTGADSAGGITYPGVLVPTATANNYTITPVNGNFTILPADTLLIRVSDVNQTYGSSTNFSVVDAEYLTLGNVLRSVTVTPVGANSFTYTDNVVGGATTGTFNLVSSAGSSADVGNYSISVDNFTKNGSNFTTTIPSVQTGNLTVNPRTAVIAANPVVSKTYNGSLAANGSYTITNKLVGDDAVLSAAGDYTDNANVGSSHTFELYNLSFSGTKASNYSLDTSALPNLTGSGGVITRAPLTLTTSNVVKNYNGSLSTSGATTAPALTVTSGTLFANASNDGLTDTVSGGSFAFTNANAGSGNKTVTVSSATINDGNSGGNYLVTYTSNTTSTINPAPLTLSTHNVVKIYDGTLSVVGATTAPVLRVTSGSLFTNASNGNVTDTVTGGAFEFTNANAGSGNKTVTVASATLNDGNSGGNYIVTYANNSTSTINPAPLSLSTSNVVKTYNGSLSVVGASTAPALTITGTLYANVSNGGATDAVTGGSFAFANANAGSGNKVVTVSGATFATGSASNYAITYVNNSTSSILPAPLTVGVSNVVKTYDGTLSVAGASTAPSLTITGTLYSNASNGNVTDSVSGGSFAFTNANAGSSNKTVTVSSATINDGNSGGNYLVTYTSNTTSTINPAALTISGIRAQNKVFDGSNTATLNTANMSRAGLISGDSVVVSATGTFADASVGTGKLVNLSLTYTGADVANYFITDQTSTTADITAGITASSNNRPQAPVVPLVATLPQTRFADPEAASPNVPSTSPPSNSLPSNSLPSAGSANNVGQVGGASVSGGAGSAVSTNGVTNSAASRVASASASASTAALAASAASANTAATTSTDAATPALTS